MAEFFENAKDKYNLYVWTAASKVYLEKILNYIDPERSIFIDSFCRTDCTFIDIFWTKNLSKKFSDEELARTVLVDNSLYSFVPQNQNGYYIKDFRDDPKDTELTMLGEVLDTLIEIPDVRPVLKEMFSVSLKIPFMFQSMWDSKQIANEMVKEA